MTEEKETGVIKYETSQGEIKLSPAIIQKYLVHGDGKLTSQEIMMFLALCKYQRLNPFLREAYLIKYGNAPATMVVGKEAFLKKARHAKDYAGHKAWTEGEIPKMIGIAEVYVAGFQVPIRVQVDYNEYVGKKKDGTINRMWSEKPKTMLRKVALVQALREAFPEELGGMYSEEEMPVDMDNLPREPVSISEDINENQNPDINETPEPSPAAMKKVITEQQRRRLFAISKEAGKTEEEIKAYLFLLGIEHSAAIPWTQYESICAYLANKETTQKKQTADGESLDNLT